MTPFPRLCAALLVLPLTACAGVSWSSTRVDQAPAAGALTGLQAGVSTLADCLDALGAPTEVLPEEDGDGAVLVWSWAQGKGWGAFASVPFGDAFNASLNWQDDALGAHRLQLRFTPDGTLREFADDAR